MISMLALVLSASEPGTYTVSSGAPLSWVVAPSARTACHRVTADETFTIAGPSSGQIVVRVDVAKKGKLAAQKIAITLDGKATTASVTPKRPAAGTDYEQPAADVVPSEPAPIAAPRLDLGPGDHTLAMKLPKGGCVMLDGLAPAKPKEPEPVAATSTEVINAMPVSDAAPGEPTTVRTEAPLALGFTLREIVGYGGLGAGGVLALSGIIYIATRDDMQATYDPAAHQVTVTRAESRAPGWTMTGIGLTLAAAGAFALFLEPRLDLGLFAVTPLPEGGAAVAVGGAY
jgi:hypothetical protein